MGRGSVCYKSESRGFHFRIELGFFNLPDLSKRTMALKSTQLLTKMSIRNIPGNKGRPACKPAT